MKVISTNIHILLFIAISFILFSCGNNELKTEEYKEPIILNKKVTDSEAITTSTNLGDTVTYFGFIGDYEITVKLLQSKAFISGIYYYNKYKKGINLIGKIENCEECRDGGCDNVTFTEKNEKGSATIEWYFECLDNLEGEYSSDHIEGVWTDLKNEIKYRIVLLKESSSKYLHPESKMIFETKNMADVFFKKHQFLNNQIFGKRFYLLAKNNEKQEEQPLPTGLPIRIFDSFEGSEYTVVKNFKLVNDYDTLQLLEALPFHNEIGYEIKAFLFNKITPFSVSDQYGTTIELTELDKKKYYMLDELKWLIDNSDRVFGYFPSDQKVNDEYVVSVVSIYSEPNLKSKILIKNGTEDEGFFKVREAKLVNMEYWALVEFKYHSILPCTDTEVEPKPTVKGWIKIYENEGNIVLDHYSRGC